MRISVYEKLKNKFFAMLSSTPINDLEGLLNYQIKCIDMIELVDAYLAHLSLSYDEKTVLNLSLKEVIISITNGMYYDKFIDICDEDMYAFIFKENVERLEKIFIKRKGE